MAQVLVNEMWGLTNREILRYSDGYAAYGLAAQALGLVPHDANVHRAYRRLVEAADLTVPALPASLAGRPDPTPEGITRLLHEFGRLRTAGVAERLTLALPSGTEVPRSAITPVIAGAVDDVRRREHRRDPAPAAWRRLRHGVRATSSSRSCWAFPPSCTTCPTASTARAIPSDGRRWTAPRASRLRTAMIVPFAGEHVDGAAALLAERHAAHRAAEPLLADGDAARLGGRRMGARPGLRRRALDGDAIEGYLIGRVAESPAWGVHAVVDRAGSAANEPEVMRDLYAAAAGAWLDAGARLQLANVPALDGMLDPWYRLGFGQMQLHAIREPGAAERPLPDGVTVRPAGRDDLDTAIMPMATLIWEHQAVPASFTGLTPPPAEQLREDWAESFDLPDDALFVAELDGRPAGFVLLYPDDPDVGVGARSVSLSVCAVAPEARGRGVGIALTEHALRWAASDGYDTVTTDWRVPNLLSSRFWPARGFRPTFHRLHRVLGSG